MADFTGNFQNFLNIFPNMESMTQFSDQNLSQLAYHNQNLMPFSSENFFSQQPIDHFPGNLIENYPGVFHESNHILQLQQNVLPVVAQTSITTENEIQDSKKRKSMDVSESSNDLYASSVSESGIKRQNTSGRRKTVRTNKKEEEKPKEVVHVRARRGQATDSHSLAERVRRSKINERLRCLQDIVPGCYKTMGMAGMLDEIINYVQSLQNQVEFLSLKLTAASTFYDFNSEADAIEIMQRAKTNEAKELEKLIREDKTGGEGLVCSNLTLPYF